jgi:hypothetical protein
MEKELFVKWQKALSVLSEEERTAIGLEMVNDRTAHGKQAVQKYRQQLLDKITELSKAVVKSGFGWPDEAGRIRTETLDEITGIINRS